MPEEFTHETQLAIDISQLSERIGKWAEGKGFWEGEASAQWLEEVAGPELVHLSNKLYTEDSPVDGLEKHRDMASNMSDIANLIRTLEFSSKLALIHSELSEALETLRDNAADGVKNGEGNFGEELADTIIRVLDLSFHSNQDVGTATLEKVKVNDARAHRHGRKF